MKMIVKVVALVLIVCATAFATDGQQTSIANYQQSFGQSENKDGQWLYLWNAPQSSEDNLASASGGGITDPESYQQLTKSGDQWTGPGGIRLSATGGRPGPGADESGTTHGRYAISAFKVAREGYYSIGQSALRKTSADGNYIDVIVHANAWRPVSRKICQPGETIHFDTDVGYLPAGSMIYVAVGPGGNSKGDDFEMDFSICRNGTSSLQDQIGAAKAKGETHVQLVPGRYYTTNTLSIENWKVFSVDATGVTLIAPPSIRAVSVASCAGGQLDGLTIDQDPLPLTQGEVMTIDPQRLSLDLKIDDFYPIPPSGQLAGDRNMIFDARTLNQKRPAAGFNVANIERLSGDVCRLNFKHALTSEIKVGDLLSIQASGGPAAFQISDSEKMTFDSITLHSSAAFSFYEESGSDNTYRNLRLTPGPQHLLASRPRLRTSAADGFHSRDTRIGPKVSDSLFERMGDDGMAIDGPWGIVTEDSSGNQVYVTVRGENMFQTGEPLRFFCFADRSQTRTSVISFENADDRITEGRDVVKSHFPAFGGWKDYKHVYLLTLDNIGNRNLKPGDLVAFPSMNGEGFEFRNNIVRGGRSRGIIVKANGIIANNHIEDCQKPGILVYSAFGHFDAMEAQFVENLIISNNFIDNCVFMRPIQNALRYCGGIVITADVDANGKQWGCDGHKNIRVEDNTIRGVYRGVNMTISDASNVVLKNNHFEDTHQFAGGGGRDYGVDNKAVIWIDDADKVSIENCDVEGLGKYGNPNDLVSAMTNAFHITGELRLRQTSEKETAANLKGHQK